MYLNHFGLEQSPFTSTPDTDFFLDYGSHKEALQELQNALVSGEGFIKITGEVGTGKTLLCQKLLNTLNENFVAAHLSNPSLEPSALHRALAKELGIDPGYKISQSRLLELVHQRLKVLNSEGKQVVLLLDEAQTLPDETLEALRLLSNLETEKNKQVQLVLFGQPELDARLQQTHLRPVHQRMLVNCTLKPLTTDALKVYLQHRLHVAGYRGAPLFSPRALTLLQRSSRGVPRLINVFAEKAMSIAFERSNKVVNAFHMRKAIAETEYINLKGHRPIVRNWPVRSTGAIIAVLLAGFIPNDTSRSQHSQDVFQSSIENPNISMPSIPPVMTPKVSVASTFEADFVSTANMIDSAPEPVNLLPNDNNTLTSIKDEYANDSEHVFYVTNPNAFSIDSVKLNISSHAEKQPVPRKIIFSAKTNGKIKSFAEAERQLATMLAKDDDQHQVPYQSQWELATKATNRIPVANRSYAVPAGQKTIEKTPVNASDKNSLSFLNSAPRPHAKTSDTSSPESRTSKNKASALRPHATKKENISPEPGSAKDKASAPRPYATKKETVSPESGTADDKASAPRRRAANTNSSTSPPSLVAIEPDTDNSASIAVTPRPLTEKQQLLNDFHAAAKTYKRGNIEDAEQQLQDLLARDDAQHQARLLLVKLYTDQNLHSLAESTLSKGLLHHPQNVRYVSLYAQMLATQSRDSEAINVLRNALPGAGDNANVHALLAGLYQRTGNSKAAVENYLIALRLEPEHGEWWIGLGISSDQLGDSDTAAYAYGEALQHQLSGAVQRYAEKRLQELAPKNSTSKNPIINKG